MGYGDNVVAIYRNNGTLVNHLALADFLTPEDIEVLDKSVSSISWGADHHVNDRRQLVVRVSGTGTGLRNNASNFQDVVIDLDTGKPIQPKRHLFAPLHLRDTVRLQLPSVQAATATPLSPAFRCTAPREGTVDETALGQIPADVLFEGLQSSFTQTYPVATREASIQGFVVADFLINGDGQVTCVRIRSGHRLFIPAVVEGLLAARLDKSPLPSRAPGYAGTIAVVFELDGRPGFPRRPR